MILSKILNLETSEDLQQKAVNTAATISYTVHRKLATAKDFADDAEQEVFNVIKDAHEKTEDLKKYIKPPKVFRGNLINF